MRRWKPYASHGRWFALILAVVFTGGVAAFAVLTRRHFIGEAMAWDINMTFYAQLVMLCIMLLSAVLSWLRYVQVTTLWYGIDRNAVYISSLGNTEVVPLDQIRRIDFGMQVLNISHRLIQGIGSYWCDGVTADGTTVFIRSTVPPSRCLFITTATGVYAIAPAEIEVFVQDLEQRSNLGVTKHLAREIHYGPWFNTPFWQDRSSQLLLALAICINLLTVGILAWHYPQLGDTVQMRFDAIGDVAELRPRYQTLFLPLAALGVTAVNLLAATLSFRYEKLVAHLLQGASVVVQLMFCVAILSVVR
ncbi:MAG: PH domain-containing protein [Roseiflexaceae bacterium]|jgi:hypothetical protein|nr:PH domain-containing protein [Chloroflexaceae bacterium]